MVHSGEERVAFSLHRFHAFVLYHEYMTENIRLSYQQNHFYFIM